MKLKIFIAFLFLPWILPVKFVLNDYVRLFGREYDEGQASLSENIYARSNRILSDKNLNISKYTYLSDLVEFENVTAIYNEISY